MMTALDDDQLVALMAMQLLTAWVGTGPVMGYMGDAVALARELLRLARARPMAHSGDSGAH